MLKFKMKFTFTVYVQPKAVSTKSNYKFLVYFVFQQNKIKLLFAVSTSFRNFEKFNVYFFYFISNICLFVLFTFFRRDKLWIAMEFCGGGSVQDIYCGQCSKTPYYKVLKINNNIIICSTPGGNQRQQGQKSHCQM